MGVARFAPVSVPLGFTMQGQGHEEVSSSRAGVAWIVMEIRVFLPDRAALFTALERHGNDEKDAVPDRQPTSLGFGRRVFVQSVAAWRYRKIRV